MKSVAFLGLVVIAAAWVLVNTKVALADSGSFRHRRSKLLAKMGMPRHSAADVVASPRSPATLVGKFAYTKASKDLEDEEVIVEIARGKRWRRIGKRLTDSDGRVRFEVPGRYLRRPGLVRFRMTVTGDGTRADGTIWVWAPETRVVVFDIDGTLTPGDREIIKRAVWGSAVKVRSGAADVVRHWVANSAITPIYLTGRPYLFSADTRRWLERHKFPSGPLITADSLRQALPSSGGVGLYKETWLKQLIGVQKLSIIAAYGNADTDICAFARAGISPAVTYIFGDDSRRCDEFDPPQWIADFVDHLGGLSPGETRR